MNTRPSLGIVVPCFNEEDVLPTTIEVLDKLILRLIEAGKITRGSHVYYVDDGSKDKTWDILFECSQKNYRVVALKLSRNKGHQNALYSGLLHAPEDVVVSIDADLQDDPENIEKMIDHYLDGSDIVFGVRNERQTDSFFKRVTAEGYYLLMQKMGVDVLFNHADFRLMSRRSIEAFRSYPETNLFLRGIVRELGFNTSIVEYERKARDAGESKYPLRKMLSLAWDGITSFSTVPLRVITVMGICSGIISLFFLAWVFFVRIFTDNAIPGWASILVPMLFVGSVQLMSLGVIGEYLAKLYKEVKRRPKFHISDISQRKEIVNKNNITNASEVSLSHEELID